MERSFGYLIQWLENLEEEYKLKKTHNLEKEWLGLVCLGEFIEKKIEMKYDVAKETCDNMTSTINTLFSLETKLATIAKMASCDGIPFFESMNPLRTVAEDWPPKSRSCAVVVLAMMETALRDMSFYYNLYKEDDKLYLQDFFDLKKAFFDLKTGLKLEECLFFSVRNNIAEFQKGLVEFEGKLRTINMG